MTKKILALVLALTMVMSLCTVMVGAAVERTLTVPANVVAKVAGGEDAEYADSITITESSVGRVPAFDFKAYVDTEALLANVVTMLDGDESINDKVVTGDIELILTIPANITASVDNVTVIENNIFTAGEPVIEENELKITISVIAEKTVADLMAAAGEDDIAIICEDVQPTAFGTYEVTGVAEGALDVEGLLTVNCVLGAISEEDSIAATINVNKKTSGGGGGGVDYPYEDKEDKPADPTPVDPTPVDPTPSEGFTDVKGHWAEEAISFVVEKNLFKGTSATTFSPNASTTRGMIAVVLHNYEENPVHDYAGDFKDVEHNQWYTEGIAWLSATGVTTGYPDGTFGHGDNVTREQLAAFLYRFAAHKGYDVAFGEIELAFADADAISAYAEEAIKWATANGIMNGKSGNILDPKGFATRAEVAAMMQRFVLAYNK